MQGFILFLRQSDLLELGIVLLTRLRHPIIKKGAVLDNPIMGSQRDYEKESYQPIEARPLD